MFTLIAAGVGWALYRVYTLRWVCDDAFISYRYAKHLASGLGLVFNAGERVEGYTNFLWVLLTAAGFKLNIDPVSLSMWAGGLCYFATAALLLYISWRLSGRDWTQLGIPVALWCWLVFRDAHVWATGGLETSCVALLVTALYVVLAHANRPWQWLTAGGLIVLALLSRPDSLVYLACACVFVVVACNRPVRSLCLLLLPVLLVYVPYWLWRYSYFGFPFPNTYYAKSGDLAYWSQGLQYLRLFFESYYALLLVFPALAYLGWRLLPWTSGRLEPPLRRAVFLAVLLLVAHLVYVARVGGDYMLARFIIPVAPLMLVVIEMAWRTLRSDRRHDLLLALPLVALMVLRWDPFESNRYRYMVVDEWSVYPRAWHDVSKIAGGHLKRCLSGVPIRIASGGERMAWAYYADLPVVLEATGGLTDTSLAHQPLSKRSRPGHEKWATPEFLESHGYHLLLSAPYYDEHPIDSLRRIRVAGLDLRLITYDRELMDQLYGRAEVEFIHLPSYLDTLLSAPADSSLATWEERQRFFNRFYFKHNEDSARQLAMEARLQDRAAAQP